MAGISFANCHAHTLSGDSSREEEKEGRVFAGRRKIIAVFPSSDGAGTCAETTPDAPIDCGSSGRARTPANQANWHQQSGRLELPLRQTLTLSSSSSRWVSVTG